MKKLPLFLLPLIALFISCSSDSDFQADEATVKNSMRTIMEPAPDCLMGLEGSLYFDLSKGLNNPVAVFSANVTGGAPRTNYNSYVEIELLSDCEDLNSGNGVVTTFEALGSVQNPSVNTPKINVSGSLLPPNPCYRWRVVVEALGAQKGKVSCVTVSEWYDAPLF
jgi:hypothetical protein